MNKMSSAPPAKIMATYVAFLRALSIIHQQNHWQCSGPTFFGNHLLFERLYNSSVELLDAAAEKAVGLFESEAIDMSNQMPVIQKLCEKYSYKNFESEFTAEAFLKSSLEAEQDFIKFSKSIYDSLKESGNLSLGLDDLLMSTASKAEEAVYLLKQALK
jgi:DNA-binding ferritin-like protein